MYCLSYSDLSIWYSRYSAHWIKSRRQEICTGIKQLWFKVLKVSFQVWLPRKPAFPVGLLILQLLAVIIYTVRVAIFAALHSQTKHTVVTSGCLFSFLRSFFLPHLSHSFSPSISFSPSPLAFQRVAWVRQVVINGNYKDAAAWCTVTSTPSQQNGRSVGEMHVL